MKKILEVLRVQIEGEYPNEILERDLEFLDMIEYFHSVENKEYVNILLDGDDEDSAFKNPFAYVRTLDILEAVMDLRKYKIVAYN